MHSVKFLPSVIALIVGTTAFAQQGQPGSHFIENWDLDGDGQVSLQEAQEKRSELFVMFDQDEDNTLNSVEYELFDDTRQADMNENAGGHKKGPMRNADQGMNREFNDVDGDGVVSKAEFNSKSEDWFILMDRNEDGVVTTDDFKRKGG